MTSSDKQASFLNTLQRLGENVGQYASETVEGLWEIREPTIRLGVTGLSRSGKTIFITALIHSLMTGRRLPKFKAQAEGRLISAELKPQPDDQVPRFAVEKHIQDLLGHEGVENRRWPESTSQISQVRVKLHYASNSMVQRNLGSGVLNIDIIDYPGEWLLDLPLLHKSYEEWCVEALTLSNTGSRKALAADWHKQIEKIEPTASESEEIASNLASTFTAYLKSCREEKHALSALAPGRFLMPGDMAGSPALTFSPLEVAPGTAPGKGSLHAMMARRYEAYKQHVVKPFYRDHFAKLDRQIVLVDTLSAINAGPNAVADLRRALTDILGSFNPGQNSWLSRLFTRRIDRVLFAATKADHLHHTNHARLEAVLSTLLNASLERTEDAGAAISVLALASIRATREVTLKKNGSELECIAGTPEAGQHLGDQKFDGIEEFAFFPGDLPEDARAFLDKLKTGEKTSAQSLDDDVRFLRFRPPKTEKSDGDEPSLPHIRLDRAIDFLIGDALE